MKSTYFQLLLDFTRRDISSKYRKSYFGFLWAVLTPLFTWAVYAVVFSGVIGLQKLPGVEVDKWEYIFSLFVGLSVFFFFSEVLTGSPDYISSKPSFVKKVVFPLSILVISKVLSSAVSLCINLVLLMIFVLIGTHTLPITLILFPIVIIPIVIFTIGMAIFISSLGVFIPDVSQITRPLARMLFYATPIVYPLSLLPEPYRSFIWLNPMTNMVEPLRAILLQGVVPDWNNFGIFILASILIFGVGYFLFVKLNRGFADVL